MNNDIILQNLSTKKSFSLYSCCIPVKGIKRGVIYDLQRGEIYYVPNSILDILDQNKNIIEVHDKVEKNRLITALNYLFQNDIIFFTNTELGNFPAISETFDEIPEKIEVLSIEIDNYSNNHIFFNDLDLFGISEMVLIQSSKKNLIRSLKHILFSLTKSVVQNIYLIVPDNVYLTSDFTDLIKNNVRIKEIIVYSSKNETIKKNIKYTSKALIDVICRRISSINDFVINTKSYIESKNRNLYFNKRVYIDNKGFVKHSYDDPKSYGNINDSKLETIVFSTNFEELFKINKDSIKECRNCEFRYICPDNRIPKKIGYNNYSHETFCNYNPNTLTWRK